LIDVFPIEMLVKNYEHHAKHKVFLEILKLQVHVSNKNWPSKKTEQKTRRPTSEASDPDLEEAELTDQEASDWSGSPVFSPRKIGLEIKNGYMSGQIYSDPKKKKRTHSKIVAEKGTSPYFREI